MSVKLPVDLQGMVEIERNATVAYLKSIPYWRDISSNVSFWESSSITDPDSSMDSNKDLMGGETLKLYYRIFERELEGKLRARANEFAARVNYYYGNDTVVISRVFDLSLLKDILRGQLVPDVLREFEIYSWGKKDGFFASSLTDEQIDTLRRVTGRQISETGRRLMTQRGIMQYPPQPL